MLYVTFVRKLRLFGCARAARRARPAGTAYLELAHEPGEEIQFDWLDLRETPWGEPV